MKDCTGYRDAGWEVAPGKVVLKTPVVTISSGPVICKRSGREKEFYLFDFPDWVNIIALTPDRKLVLIKQFRYGSSRHELEIPGGMIDEGEHPVEAGCRELLEETGYAGGNARIIGKVCPNPAIQRNSCHTVLVEDVIKVSEPCFDDMEDIECLIVSEQEVWQMLESGKIDHGLVLNAMMFYRLFKQKQ